MKKIVRFFVCLCFTVSSFGQELQKFYSEAMTAYKNKNYPEFYSKIKEANKLHPYHQGILYQLGIAAALTGKDAEAVQYLKKAIQINADFRLEGIADFNSIKETKEFKELLALQKELQRPIVNSEI